MNMNMPVMGNEAQCLELFCQMYSSRDMHIVVLERSFKEGDMPV